ncbi:MAG TPA: PAS domain S-box protein [Flavobacteriales bacterium]|nr:PAS domain S-box protein [Flavobacteriales bacterium]
MNLIGKIILRSALALLIVAMARVLCSGQSYDFINYSIEDGLGQSQVTDIVQDHMGVIWMASNGGGLTCYDGQTFTVFTTDNGLADNVVNKIFEDDNNQLWICTAKGISRWLGPSHKGGSNHFVNFTEDDGLADNQVWTGMQDQAGRLMFGTNDGLSILLTSEDQVPGTRFKNSKLGLSHNIVRSLLQDSEGVFWYGTENGLTRHDPSATGEVYSYYSTKDGLADAFIWSSLEDSEGNLWFGTGLGISRLKKGDIGNVEQKFESKIWVDDIKLNIIYDIEEDAKGNIWFAAWANVGAIEYVPKFNAYRRMSKENGLADNNVVSILKDNEGNLWMGTYGQGVSKFRGRRFENYTRDQGLPDNFIGGIKEDVNHNIWIGGNGGISRMVRNKNPERICGYNYIVQQFSPADGFPSKQVNSMAEDRSGNLWFCTENGLVTLKMPAPLFASDGKSKPRLSFQVYTVQQGLLTNRPITLYEDSRGGFWLGYKGGMVQRMTIEGGKAVFQKNIYKSELLNSFTTYAIHEDQRGDMWFGTGAGIVKLLINDSTGAIDQEVNITTRDGLVHDDVRAIVEDTEGNLWFGTGGGLSIFNPYQPGKRFENYTSEDGLVSDRICLLQFDNENKLWIGTNVGLDVLDVAKYKATKQKYDPIEHKHVLSGDLQFRHFGYAEGFVGNEVNTGASCKDADGSLWFGSIAGAIKYNSEEDALNAVPPIIQIVGVDIHSDPVDISALSEFKYDESHLTFKFMGISHRLQEGVKYKHRLQGYSYEWSDPSTTTTINYTNLSVGAYKFEVLAANADGVWNKVSASYSFTIVPPFWKSIWFYILVIAGFIAIVYSIVKIRLRALEQTARALTTQVEIKTAKLQASEQQYRKLFDTTGDCIFIYDQHTHEFLDCNDTVVRVYGYSKEEIKTMKPYDLHPDEDPEDVRKLIDSKQDVPRIYEHVTKSGKKIYVEVQSSTVRFDQKEAVLSIVRDITKRREDAQKIESINKQLTGSIRYSKRILDAVLRSKSEITQVHPNSFILFKPKDIVSGDFYWFHKIDGKTIVAAIDCTGHGVAGAFMSLIGNEILDDVVKKKKIVNPGKILSAMHKAVVTTLKKGDTNGDAIGGMDVALCCLDYEKNTLEFAGAGRSLTIWRDGVEMVYSGNKFPVGLVFDKDGKYSNVYMNEKKTAQGVIKSEKIDVKKGDSIYLFTDGYCDQFGGESGEKFMGERLSSLLATISAEDMNKQEAILESTMAKWQGDRSQVDDMLVIGMKI